MLLTLLRLAVHHLTQRRVRTVVTIIGVALGVSVSVAMRSANVEVLRSFTYAVSTVAGRATLQVSAGELGLDERLIVAVRDVPGIHAASPVLYAGARIAAGPH